MLKQEIVEKITKYFKLTNYEAERIFDDIIQNIITGVKEENISEVNNLGEFILKVDERTEGSFKNGVEFLLSRALEEQLSNADVGAFIPKESVEQKSDIQNTTDEIEDKKLETPVEQASMPTAVFTQSFEQPLQEEKILRADEIKEVNSGEQVSIEDEIKKKREEIIHKLDPQHQESYHPLLHVTEGIPLNVPKPIVLKEETRPQEIVKEEEIKEKVQEVKEETEEQNSEVSAGMVEKLNEEEEVDEISSKSFSDYFREVKQEQKLTSTVVTPPPVPQVIPPAAVDLHKEITGEEINKVPLPIQGSGQVSEVIKEGNGYLPEKEGQEAMDNSYYIWYKDSEPNPVDTQTMSYEYELLYQATKEAEYKSKLRIYVTTFILFFSIVLLLLIFSPVIYKYFFTQSEEQVITDTPPVTNTEESKTQPTEPTQDQSGDNKTTTPLNTEQQNTQESQSNTPTSEPGTQNEQAPVQQNIEGLAKTEAGWKDEKTGYLYVPLDNGKFSIQESAWNSEEKAKNRISKIASQNIPGMSGSFVKVDLGAKGTWYRVRLGEFSTLDETRQKAAVLKSKGF